MGVDLSGVRVHRSELGGWPGQVARRRAYTDSPVDVHVPHREGSLDHGEGRALLVHELVHAAQRRRPGHDVPPEGTALGRLLESEAVQVGRELTGHSPLPGPPVEPTPVPSVLAHASDWGGPREGGPDRVLMDLGSGPPTPAVSQPDVHRRLDAPSSHVQGWSEPGTPAVPGGEDEHARLEELARQLYEPLRDRLRAELRTDRERLGLLLADVD